MSIRVLVCLIFVLFFSVYAWKNWFPSLCAAILMMAVLEHPDMPKSIGGIQGLNLWNILLANVGLAWLRAGRLAAFQRDFPASARKWLLLYFMVIVVSSIRMVLAPGGLPDYSFGSAFSEYFINCFKWVIPGLLMFDACRSANRVKIALVCILGIYVLLAIQVIRWMPLSYAISGGEDLQRRAVKITVNEIGFHRVNLSMMLSGACWAVLSTMVLVKKQKHQFGILLLAGIVAMGQALTGGRMGYVTWGLVGLALCTLRWRKLLPLIPAGILAVAILLPGVRERMLQGFASNTGPIVQENDTASMTSGRTLAWPYVIAKIKKSPLLGYGREAMLRQGIAQQIMEDYGEGESFPHPHNAYLQLLLDTGLIGFSLVVPFYFVVVRQSLSLFLDKQDPLCAAVGGVALSLLLALLIAAMGSQTFYPREGAVGMWAALGVMWRVWVEREHSLDTGAPRFSEEGWENESEFQTEEATC